MDIETIEKRIQTSTNLKKGFKNLQDIYKKRGINLVCIKNKWSFRTAEDLSKLMALQKSTHKKLSKATVETLAIIVYHQPVTRSEIEEIRGVSFATNTLEILLELDWVRPAGRKDVPGKPIQYATTENFSIISTFKNYQICLLLMNLAPLALLILLILINLFLEQVNSSKSSLYLKKRTFMKI